MNKHAIVFSTVTILALSSFGAYSDFVAEDVMRENLLSFTGSGEFQHEQIEKSMGWVHYGHFLFVAFVTGVIGFMSHWGIGGILGAIAFTTLGAIRTGNWDSVVELALIGLTVGILATIIAFLYMELENLSNVSSEHTSH